MSFGQPLSAGGLILEVGLEYGLIFGGQWRLLCETPSFTRIELHGVADRMPLPLEVGIRALVPSPSFGRRQAERGQEGKRGRHAAVSHGCSPFCTGQRHGYAADCRTASGRR